MKTPKRDYKTPANQLAQDIEPDFFAVNYDSQKARWKRKNRVKQLKRSLEKYKYGIHLSGSVAAAYRRLQRLVIPDKNATIAEWANYLNELRRCQEHIACAIATAALNLAYDAERKAKARKEQECSHS